MFTLNEVYVLNHKSRDCSNTVNMINDNQRDAIVFTDRTDFYKKRDENRYKGVTENWNKILSHQTDSEWKLIVHDDLEFELGVFDKIQHILNFAPKDVLAVCFFNNPHKLYQKAAENGHHIVKSPSVFWMQCTAINKRFERPFLEWYDKNIQHGIPSEDGATWRYLSFTNQKFHIVTPSLFQHEGYDRSTFKNPPSTNGIKRQARTYDPDFDVFAVDWVSQFAKPYEDNTKYLNKVGLKNETLQP